MVVFDNPTVFNRLGAQNPNWITYALRRDVVNKNTLQPESQGGVLSPGQVMLRPDKRTRPLVVRAAAGDCLTVNFQNLLSPVPNPNNPIQDNLLNNDQVADRMAGFHPQGVELVGGIGSDASFVGTNTSSLVPPGGTATYNFYTPHEGSFPVTSYGATVGSEGNAGNHGLGMFAQLNVEPKGARMYRGQLTEEEMRLAATDPVTGQIRTVPTDCAAGEIPGADCAAGGQPIIDYEALYPNVEPWISEGKAGLPIINMLDGNELVHSDINAIIAGPNADGSFPPSTYPLESVGKRVPSLPNRLEPFREFASIFHDEQTNAQVWPVWYLDPVLSFTLHGVPDAFMINYGSGGIGSEIIANRVHAGPMHDCTDCAYEEFFLASQTVGDPGMLVNFPANSGIEGCDPNDIVGTCFRDPVNLANGPIAGNFPLFQEDPANVHHAYTGDHVKIRNIHAGAFEQHIFHLHNHQWMFNPNDDNSNYLDAQEIMPGSGHTYELVNGGSGNRNKTTGDAIFHCHFYPHFAQGMWYHIRNHDVMETGTVLAVSGADDPHTPTAGFHTTAFGLRSGEPMAGARALPDGELLTGSPIPAIVPLPGKAMPPMPAKVSVMAVDRGDFGLAAGRTPPNGLGQGPDSAQAVVDRGDALGPDGLPGTADDKNPGYPFWVAGNECGVPRPASVDPGPDGVLGTADDINIPANDCPRGTVGQRAPTPVLDMLTEDGAAMSGHNPALAGGWDGGLPRHSLLGYTAGGLSHDTQTRLDFSKIVERAQPVYFPELGTDLEKVAMAYMAQRLHPSAALDLAGGVPTVRAFVMNGAPPVPGAPYQEPCTDDTGKPTTAGAPPGQTDDDPDEYWDGGTPDGYGTTVIGASDFHSGNPRTYRVANVQVDAVFNKVGYHYPQERIISLWGDVAPYINKQRPPEPLVMRFNTFDCGKILHTNLVPNEYQLDDFQVRTPTDIIGQHIHLPKWDLTTNDGAANGWNYEDGSLSPGAVVERIEAINAFNADAGTQELADLAPVPTLTAAEGADPGAASQQGATHLVALPHPYFGGGVGNEYVGSRVTIQRLFVDPVVNVSGADRGLGMTFSHDHYGPSTFQQLGLYSSIIIEPAGSTWRHNEDGSALGGRFDGGPTSWQAAILPGAAGASVKSGPCSAGQVDRADCQRQHREFYFEFSDFQHAYEAGVYIAAGPDGRPNGVEPGPETWKQAVNPPLKLKSQPFPEVVTVPNTCPGGAPRPCPEAINIAHGSMLVVNYRNEPVGLRVFDPNAAGPDGRLGTQAAGAPGDLAFALQTRTDRAVPALNTRFGSMPYPQHPRCRNNSRGDGINCDRRNGDPITPIMRVYQRDPVKIKIQSGATEEQHQFSIHGLKWLANGSGFGRAPNSGWRNFQSDGISEQFALQVPVIPTQQQAGNVADYLYATDTSRDGFWSGVWGLMRSYGTVQGDLFQLPENPVSNQPVNVANSGDFQVINGNRVCPNNAPRVDYDVTAVLANDVLPNALGVTIPPNTQVIDPATGLALGGDSDGDGLGDNVGGPLDPLGGTLVFNPRTTVVPGVVIPPEGNEPGGTLAGGAGPLNDPTAMLYVRTADLVPVDPLVCTNVNDPLCPVRLSDTAPVEPLVLRANAGDCVVVQLRNRLPFTPVTDPVTGAVTFVADPVPDLAGWQDLMWVVNRELFQPVGNRDPLQMHFFNNNLIRPSSEVGLHPQLVHYDASRSDGTNVGINQKQTASPGGAQTYVWYAGDMQEVSEVARGRPAVRLVPTPVEFGASNLMSADRVKQPQKGMFGALVIEPSGAAAAEDTQVADRQADFAATPGKTRLTRASVTVTSPPGGADSGGNFREALEINQKIASFRWADGTAVANVNQGELGREGAEDSGHDTINYGSEPAWFRFKLPPDAPFGNALTPNSFGSLPNAHELYSNGLVAGEPNTIPDILGVSAAGDPATPVFTAAPGQATRLYLLNGASTDRDSTFVLHGHVWQRDPYVCPGQSDLGLEGRCAPNTPVPSLALGNNPQAKYMGSEEGMGHAYGHWPILINAGGSDAVAGDYLFRDYSPSGNTDGLWGILRVQ